MQAGQGAYIALEGPDGGGKSTQMKHLVQAFAKAGLPHRQTREAGGTEAGKQIREILIWGSEEKLSAAGETLLFYADRHEHLRQVVRPGLQKGEYVLADRCFLSTRAYQSSRGVPLALLESLEKQIVADTVPHLMLILDVPPQTSLARKNAQQALDRFEKMGEGFQEKLRAVFLAYAEENPGRTQVIDATRTEAQVHAAILAALNARFSLALKPVI